MAWVFIQLLLTFAPCGLRYTYLWLWFLFASWCAYQSWVQAVGSKHQVQSRGRAGPCSIWVDAWMKPASLNVSIARQQVTVMLLLVPSAKEKHGTLLTHGTSEVFMGYLPCLFKMATDKKHECQTFQVQILSILIMGLVQ